MNYVDYLKQANALFAPPATSTPQAPKVPTGTMAPTPPGLTATPNKHLPTGPKPPAPMSSVPSMPKPKTVKPPKLPKMLKAPKL